MKLALPSIEEVLDEVHRAEAERKERRRRVASRKLPDERVGYRERPFASLSEHFQRLGL